MGPASTTETVLQELKNTSAHHLKKALLSELRVLEHFQKNKFKLIYHRKKLYGVEVDFLYASPEGILQIVEVKTLSNTIFAPYRLTKKQKDRLIKVKIWLEHYYNIPTQLILVLVEEHELTELIIG